MPTLPPVILEIRAQAAQFYKELAKVTEAVGTMAEETEIYINEMAAKVDTSMTSMGAKVAATAEKMGLKAAAEAEVMATRVVKEAEQMDAGTSAAVEAMSKTVTANVQKMATQTSTAVRDGTAKTQAAFKTQTDEIVASQLETTDAVTSATHLIVDALAEQTLAQEKNAQAVIAATEKIVASESEQSGAVERTARTTREAGLSMQESFIKTASTAVGSTGTIASALASSSLKQVEAAKSAQFSLMGIADGITKVAAVTGLVVAGVGLDMAAHFQKSTNLLVTAGGESKTQLESVRQGILDISSSTGTSAEQLSDGMYVMEKAGYRGAAGLAALRASAEGAKAENVDLGVMAQATTDILLDYGYKMGNASEATESSVKVVNMLVAASGAAKTTMRDFAASMAAVVPIASAAHISFEQVGGALATMTQHGQTAQQSSQNLANLIQSLIRPNNMASNAMQQFGIDVVGLAQHLGDSGLSGSLQMIHDKIIDHMGPDGLVVQDTMKKSASATADLKGMMAQMSPEIAKMSQGLLDHTVTQMEYRKAVMGTGGASSALGSQFLVLWKASEGVNDAMKAGQPAMMTYQAAMTKVLGNVTAARAATMLLMNNSDDLNRSIGLVAAAADAGGQHIQTWGETQAQLSTQLDMAKQRSENLAIEIGTKLIPVANGALQGFEDLFNGFERGNPVLLGIAAVIGVAMTASAVKFTAQMAITSAKTITAMADMAASAIIGSQGFVKGLMADELAAEGLSTKAELAGNKVRGMMGVMGGIAGVAAAGAAGLMILNSMSKEVVIDTDQMKKALADLALKGGDVGKLELDQQFTQWRTSAGMTTVNVKNMDEALQKMTHADGYSQFNNFFDGLRGAVGSTKSEVGQLQDRFKDIGNQMADMVKGGQSDTAAQAFDKIAVAFEHQGKSAQDALESMPGYKQSLIDMAAAQGQSLAPAELLDLAMGKVPDKMKTAAAANDTYVDSAGNTRRLNDDVKKSLDDMGISIDGSITDLGKLYDAMVKTGLANLSARDAEFHFGQAIQDAGTKADELKKKLGGNLASALDDTGKDFSRTTEAGQAAESAFSSVTQAGLENAKVMAHDVTKSQADVTQALKTTHDNMVATAEKFGLGSQEAEDLTRKVLNIPPGVSIESWMDDSAKRMADSTKGSLDQIDGRVVKVYTEQFESTIKGNVGLSEAQNGGPGGYTGGAVSDIMGMVDGGVVPGRPPANPRADNVLAMVNGRPLKVRSGEFITNEKQTQANLPWLRAINRGLNMNDVFVPNTPRLAYASSPSLQERASAPTINNTAHNVTNNVSINSTADARSLAQEFSRLTANRI